MRRPTSIVSASLIAAACLSNTAARADLTTTVFGAVSSYGLQGGLLTIDGVAVGASGPTTIVAGVTAGPIFDTCERALLVMLNRPGRFTLTVTTNLGNVNGCSLSQSP